MLCIRSDKMSYIGISAASLTDEDLEELLKIKKRIKEYKEKKEQEKEDQKLAKMQEDSILRRNKLVRLKVDDVINAVKNNNKVVIKINGISTICGYKDILDELTKKLDEMGYTLKIIEKPYSFRTINLLILSKNYKPQKHSYFKKLLIDCGIIEKYKVDPIVLQDNRWY